LVIVSVVAIALLAVGGCGEKGLDLVKISGTVKYKDGSPVWVDPSKGRAMITFMPADSQKEAAAGEIRKGANGKIDADGHFTMGTLRPGDGVIPGKYKVIFVIREDNPKGAVWLIPEKYGNMQTSGEEITVDKARSDVDYVFDKIR
jgi:hypothetical protein